MYFRCGGECPALSKRAWAGSAKFRRLCARLALAVLGAIGLAVWRGGFRRGLLIWRGNRFGYFVFMAMLGYAARFQESDNFWDYLLDPVYGAVSLLVILWMIWRRWTSGPLVPTLEGLSGRRFR